MASIIPTLKHLVSRGKRVQRMDSIEEEDADSPLTPKKFEESFFKGESQCSRNVKLGGQYLNLFLFSGQVC